MSNERSTGSGPSRYQARSQGPSPFLSRTTGRIVLDEEAEPAALGVSGSRARNRARRAGGTKYKDFEAADEEDENAGLLASAAPFANQFSNTDENQDRQAYPEAPRRERPVALPPKDKSSFWPFGRRAKGPGPSRTVTLATTGTSRLSTRVIMTADPLRP